MTRSSVVSVTEGPVTVLWDNCLMCGNIFELKVETAQFLRWITGEHVQVAFPQLSADQRELLISSTCGECYDKMCDRIEAGALKRSPLEG